MRANFFCWFEPVNGFLLFKIVLDKITEEAVTELKPRWINRLAGVDVWLESRVRTALIYVRWADKVMESAAEAARRRHNAIARSISAESIGGTED